MARPRHCDVGPDRTVGHPPRGWRSGPGRLIGDCHITKSGAGVTSPEKGRSQPGAGASSDSSSEVRDPPSRPDPATTAGGKRAHTVPEPNLALIDEQSRHGWEIYPADDEGVKRGGIKLGQLRVWIVPKAKLINLTQTELGGGIGHPGLYLLLSPGNGRAYVGESHDLQSRLNSHTKSPPREQGDFDLALILNDGRNAAQSLFNDHTLRLAVEQSIVLLLSEQSRWTVTNKVKDSAPLSTSQRILHRYLEEEVAYAMYQLRILERLPQKRVSASQISPTIIRVLFPERDFSDLSEFEGKLEGLPVYFRDGSDKHKVGSPSRWQVTIPFGEPFGIDVKAGNGFLCFNRGPGYLIPLADLRDWLQPKLHLQKADIFFDLDRDLASAPKIEPLDLRQFRSTNASKD